MKKLIILALLFGLSGSCLAKYALWQPNEKPKIGLSQALAKAQKALGPKQRDFYCLNATLAVTRSSGDWIFQFGSKNSGQRHVMVSANNTIRVSNTMFEF